VSRGLRRLLAVELAHTHDHRRAERSRWVWGAPTEPGGPYVLRPLGIINGVRLWLDLPPWSVRL
jgi:hypothetical protein